MSRLRKLFLLENNVDTAVADISYVTVDDDGLIDRSLLEHIASDYQKPNITRIKTGTLNVAFGSDAVSRGDVKPFWCIQVPKGKEAKFLLAIEEHKKARKAHMSMKKTLS